MRAAAWLVVLIASSASAAPSTDPWEPGQTYLVGDVVVALDIRGAGTRLRVFEAATGAPVVTREFDTSALCHVLTRGRLICMVDGALRVVDARTLVDGLDVHALIAAELPPMTKPGPDPSRLGSVEWMNMATTGDAIEVEVPRLGNVRIDLATRKLTRVAPGRVRGRITPGLCPPALVAAEVMCPGKGGRYAKLVTSSLDTTLHRLDGKTGQWTVTLRGVIGDVWRSGDLLIVGTYELAHRVVALDAATGAVRWEITK